MSVSCKRPKVAKDLKRYGVKASSSVFHQTQVPTAQELVSVTMAEPAERSSTAGQRLGAPESFGVSTLEPGLRPPGQPPGRQVPIRVQMLDDTQEVFEIPVSHFFLFTLNECSAKCLPNIYIYLYIFIYRYIYIKNSFLIVKDRVIHTPLSVRDGNLQETSSLSTLQLHDWPRI